MNLLRLVLREIRHRKINFLLSVLGAAVAVAAVLSTVAALRDHDAQTESLIGGMEKATQAEMTRLEDEIRKSMKGLGFNLFIFPKDQDLSEVYAEGFASKTMPEDYVMKLASSDIVTVNHLLPSLTQKLEWPEQKRTVILIGVRGEIPIMERPQKGAILDPVAPGKVILGHELHRSLGLKEGDRLTFMGREFTVDKTYSPRGSRDDITIWMHLPEVQSLLGKPGLINAIQALECNCETVDRLGEIRAELHQILPDTQIIETESTALARAEARNTAAATARQQIEAKKTERAALKAERGRLAGLLLPLATVVSLVWIGLLAFINVRERLVEIGILRAVGVKGRAILGAFLARAVVAGLIGGVIGVAAATFVRASEAAPAALIGPMEMGIAILAAPLLAAVAAWLPALAAAQRDPADVLRHD
jgi:putative ABC transport system permease protein